jgi:hypothetical protein
MDAEKHNLFVNVPSSKFLDLKKNLYGRKIPTFRKKLSELSMIEKGVGACVACHLSDELNVAGTSYDCCGSVETSLLIWIIPSACAAFNRVKV